MTNDDRAAVLLYQLLFNEETSADDGCAFSFEVMKRNPRDEYAALKHYENCVRLRHVKMLLGKVKEVLDSLEAKGV